MKPGRPKSLQLQFGQKCDGNSARNMLTRYAFVGLVVRELADHALRRKGGKTTFYAVQRDAVQRDEV